MSSVTAADLEKGDAKTVSRYAKCPYCGRRMRRVLDSWGSWDGESNECDCSEFAGDEDSEGLSVYDAAEIWLSSGMDEDQTFGYSEDELRDALR